MTKASKSSIAINYRAVEAVEALAHSQGKVLGPVRAGSYLADFPAHVTLDGVNTRVTAAGPRNRADRRKVHVFDVGYFSDISWQILACMPEDPIDDPILFKLPRTVWTQHSRILIDLQDPGEFSPYRWSPETRWERQQRAHLDEHVWDYC